MSASLSILLNDVFITIVAVVLYNTWQSESTVGAWLRSTGHGEMRVATKGTDREMTREGIRAQFAESLDRLRLSRVAA